MGSNCKGTSENSRKKTPVQWKYEEMVARQNEHEIYLAFSIRKCNDNNDNTIQILMLNFNSYEYESKRIGIIIQVSYQAYTSESVIK